MLITPIILAFLEGLALIISPCILPILPIILSSSWQGDKSKPFGIITGFIFSFTLFTYFSRTIVLLSGIDLNLVRNFALILLVALGLVMMSDYFSAKFAWLMQRFTNVGVSGKNYSKFEFINGLVFGSLLGIIWTPCAGPILAAVIVQTVLQQTNFASFLLIFAFTLGVGIPMLAMALLGRQVSAKLQWLHHRGMLLRKLLGFIIILSVIYIYYGTIAFSVETSKKNTFQMRVIDGLFLPYPAPPIAGIAHWINSKPLTISQLKGNVVLIDFWTYSCINCIRTLPYLKDWYQKYHHKGFVIIGVHSPEFGFEHQWVNVQKAVKNEGIVYPVALDNGFVTWKNYHNRYWPAHYLIDREGRVVYTHFGEGHYDITENNIRFLLEINQPMSTPALGELTFKKQTPEMYLGYSRADHFSSPEKVVHDQPTQYHYPTTLPIDAWALQGEWTMTAEKIITTKANASIIMHFQGKKVFAVMGTATNAPIKVSLLLNGKPLTPHKEGIVVVSHHGLYPLIAFNQPTEGILELVVEQPGLVLYTFTFG